MKRVRVWGSPPRRTGKPLTARQIQRATGATRADMESVRASLRAAGFGWAVARPCATCGKHGPAHALAWVSTGEGTRHGHRYNDRDRPAGRSLCGRPLPRGVRCVGGIHGGDRNCKACLRAAKGETA